MLREANVVKVKLACCFGSVPRSQGQGRVYRVNAGVGAASLSADVKVVATNGGLSSSAARTECVPTWPQTRAPWYRQPPAPGLAAPVGRAGTGQAIHPNPVNTKTFLHNDCGVKRKAQTTRGIDTDEGQERRFYTDASVNPSLTGSRSHRAALAAAPIPS